LGRRDGLGEVVVVGGSERLGWLETLEGGDFGRGWALVVVGGVRKVMLKEVTGLNR